MDDEVFVCYTDDGESFLRKLFAFYHPANTQEKRDAHEGVRNECFKLAVYLHEKDPDSEEMWRAIDKLQEVMFWANAGIARAGK